MGPGDLPPQPRRALTRCAAACALAASGLLLAQLRRLARARALLREAPPVFARPRAWARQRILLVGDSTGAGVGCAHAGQSMAAAVAHDWPDAAVDNLCTAGARVTDVLAAVRALPAQPSHDLVMVFAGGNDVLRFTRPAALERAAHALNRELRLRSPRVVWAGMANVGLAPLFLPPFSWLLGARARKLTQLLARCAADSGARYVDFFRGRRTDPFSADPDRFYARDRVHPSAAAYAWCYRRLQPLLQAALREPPRRKQQWTLRDRACRLRPHGDENSSVRPPRGPEGD